jgi:hypothetical protein
VLDLPVLPVARSLSTPLSTQPSQPDHQKFVDVRPAPRVRPIVGGDPGVRQGFATARLAAQRTTAAGGRPEPWWSPSAGTTPTDSFINSAPVTPAWIPPGPDGQLAFSSGDRQVALPAAWPAAAAISQAAAQRSATRPGMPLARASITASRSATDGTSAPERGHFAVAPAAMPSAAAPTVQAVLAGPSPSRDPAPKPEMPAISARPVVQRIEGVAPVPEQPTPTFGKSDRELEELAQALFGRIRRRFRSELIHDREAKGLGFDHV